MKIQHANFVTVRQLSDMSGSRKETIMRHLAKGSLKGEKVNRRWLIPRSEAERFAADPPRVGTVWQSPPAGFASVEEVADKAGVGVHLVRAHIREGKLEARFLEGRWCIPRGEIEKYLAMVA